MPKRLQRFTDGFREAPVLTADRATAYARVLLVMFIAVAVVWVALSHGGIDVKGKPLGTDFLSFWTASKLALAGQPTAPYDMARHFAEQTATFNRDVGYAAFFYPPPFLLICLPLALLPYSWALLAWLVITGTAYLKVLRAYAGERLGWVPLLAFPAIWTNIGHGQNGFLSAALLAGGALLLPTRPILAGFCLGSLIYKPHLGLVIPVALIAARRWEAFTAAGVAAIGTCLISYLVFGVETWQAFAALTSTARATLEQSLVGDAKMQSLFAAVRLHGGGLGLAYGLQVVLSLSVCVALVLLQRRSFRSSAEGPATVAAALLASPFLLDYDLTLLAIPLAWCTREAMRSGFLPYEKSVLAIGFILPLLSRTLAMSLGLPVAPLVLLAVFALVLRRGIFNAASVPTSQPLASPFSRPLANAPSMPHTV
jgi:alpha-1,2-mannosyltransferase